MSSSSDNDSGADTPKAGGRSRSSSSSSAPSHRSGSQTVANQFGEEAAADSGSERSHASPSSPPQPTKRRLMDSSDEDDDENNVTQKATKSDVFGDEISSDSDKSEGDVIKSEDEEETNQGGQNYSQTSPPIYDQQEELPEPKVIQCDIPHMKFSIGEDLYHVRMPNFLSIETRPFVPEEYEDVYDENDLQDEEGRNRLKLKVENTLRWRQVGPEDNPTYESNAKMVKWSDGSMSLMVGSEIFECQETGLLAATHLYVKQSHGLSAKAIFNKRLKFRPSTTDSKTHKKVTMNMADRSKKSGQVRLIEEVGGNPDEAKKEIIRKEEEALRAAYRRERDQTIRIRRDRGRAMTSGFLEDRGDYSEDESPKRGRGRKEAPLIGASSDESDTDAKKLEKSKRDSSDSDEEVRRKQDKKKRIVSSEEESD